MGTRVTWFAKPSQSAPHTDFDPWQFWTVLDRPLLYYTLKAFDGVPWLSEVVVAVAPDRLEWAQTSARDCWMLKKTRFVVGGSDRHSSIAACVRALGGAVGERQEGEALGTGGSRSQPVRATPPDVESRLPNPGSVLQWRLIRPRPALAQHHQTL